MSKTVGYIRVSSKDQCLERQIAVLQALGIEEKYIYQDKQSGKDFDRTGYQYMKKCLEPGDTLVIKELDRIGRNQEELKREWQYFRDNEINVRVLDLPALNINYDDEFTITFNVGENPLTVTRSLLKDINSNLKNNISSYFEQPCPPMTYLFELTDRLKIIQVDG